MADIALFSDERGAGVHANAYEDRAVSETPSERRCRGECCVGKAKKKASPCLRIDLDTSLGSAGVADQSAMFGERPTVPPF